MRVCSTEPPGRRQLDTPALADAGAGRGQVRGGVDGDASPERKVLEQQTVKSGGQSFSSDMLPMPRLWASAPEASGLKSPSLDQLLLSDLKVRPPIPPPGGTPTLFLHLFIPKGFKSK